MQNLVYLIGRIVSINETLSESNEAMVSVAVHRNYKNTEGVYETDIIDCTLWKGIANNVTQYCKTGDLIGIKGRIEMRLDEDKSKQVMKIITEKVSFLSSKMNQKKDKCV